MDPLDANADLLLWSAGQSASRLLNTLLVAAKQLAAPQPGSDVLAGAVEATQKTIAALNVVQSSHSQTTKDSRP